MELKTRHIRGSMWYSSQIELIINSENTTIVEDLIPYNGYKVSNEFIANLENLIQELKDHNQNVDDYNETI
jgi:hypothetical protein